MFKRLIHSRSLSRTINISMLNLISIETEKRKTWEDELPFPINDTPFVKTFLMRRKATNQREGRKKPRELLIFLFQRLQPACAPLS